MDPLEEAPEYDRLTAAVNAVCRATEARVCAEHIRAEATRLREEAELARINWHNHFDRSEVQLDPTVPAGSR
ncbi:MAG TPA: hypothetical protein VKD90_19080 [Gemmataceae bacterium]|nr:hypothetical protein [Gemmataceae bacterium]